MTVPYRLAYWREELERYERHAATALSLAKAAESIPEEPLRTMRVNEFMGDHQFFANHAARIAERIQQMGSR